MIVVAIVNFVEHLRRRQRPYIPLTALRTADYGEPIALRHAMPAFTAADRTGARHRSSFHRGVRVQVASLNFRNAIHDIPSKRVPCRISRTLETPARRRR